MAQITLNSTGVASNGSLVLQSNGTTAAVTIDTSQNVGIGTSSPSTKLDVAGVARTQNTADRDGITIKRTNNANANGALNFTGSDDVVDAAIAMATDVADALTFRTAGSERARINSSGNFMVGTTDANPTIGSGIKSEPGTNPRFSIVTASSTTATALSIYSTGAADYRFFVDPDGKIYATFTTIGAISDQRLKENIQDLDVGLDAVMALKPRKFDWREGKGKNIKGDRGWIAQEFEQVFPDMIDEWKDESPEGEDPYKSVRADLIPVLVKAIQEQQALIQTLTDRITALEAK
jgi:hypothetical protein